jgi:predicted signal transduction protein with EAL and GGDEF domain
VLQAVGRAIDSAVRDRDLSFRFGGDEFAILLPRTRATQASQIADRVRQAIKQHPIVAGTLTASAGVACLSVRNADKAALIAAADAALYRAKAAGGDRTEVSGRKAAKPRQAQLAAARDANSTATDKRSAAATAVGRQTVSLRVRSGSQTQGLKPSQP